MDLEVREVGSSSEVEEKDLEIRELGSEVEETDLKVRNVGSEVGETDSKAWEVGSSCEVEVVSEETND